MSSELEQKGIKPVIGWDDSEKIYFVYRDKDKQKQIYTLEGFEWYFCLRAGDYEKNFDEIKKIENKSSSDRIEEWVNNEKVVRYEEGEHPIRKVEKLGDFVKIYCNKNNLHTNRFVRYLQETDIELKEADLSLLKRYMIDNSIEIEEDLSILFFDIETNDTTPGIEIGRDEIVSWAAEDSLGQKHFNIAKSFLPSDEKRLICSLLKLFMKYDMIVGWNSRQFDIAYITNRIDRLNITGKDFGEPDINLNQTNYWKKIIHVDLMQRLIKLFGPMMTVAKLTGFSLNEVAQAFIGEQKLEREEKIHELFKNNPEKLKRYNLKDVKLLFQINEKLRTIPLMIKECAWTGTFMNRFYIGELLDNYILREANLQNFHLKTRPREGENPESIRVRGGFVMEPETGLYSNLRTLDFKCFAKGTKVYTDNGYKNIEDITIADKVQDIDNKFSKIKTFSKQKYQGVLKKITTTNGYTIECTPNHEWPILENGEIILKKAKDLTLKDSLSSPVRFRFKDNFYRNSLFELLGVFYFESTCKKIKHRTKKDYISNDYRVQLSLLKTEIEFKNRISFLLKNLTPFDFEWKEKKNSLYLKIGNKLPNDKRNTKEVYEWLQTNFKKLETLKFLNSSYNLKVFCKAAFEADGTVNTARGTVVINSGTKYKTDRKERIFFLHYLLKRLGINSNIGKHLNTIILEIYRTIDLYDFRNKISFISMRKKVKLREIIYNRTFRLFSKRKKRKEEDFGEIKFIKRKILKIEDILYDGYVYNLGLENQTKPFYIANDLLTKNSMYPSIIVGWNIGQESLLEGRISRVAQEDSDKWLKERKIEEVSFREWYAFLRKENKKLNPDNAYLQTANNQFFKRDKPSIISGLVKRLLQERKAYKKQQLDAEYDSIEYKNAQASQEAVKEMSNSMFGITADKQARYFDPRISEAITLTAQYMNRMSMEILKKKGYRVIYGDTDSIFTIIDDDEETIKAIEELNKDLTAYLIKTYKLPESIIHIEYEKKFRKFIMLDKKRYCGHLVEIDGKKVDSVLSKGTENVRKSTIDFTKNKVNECLNLIVKQDKGERHMKKWIRELKEFVLNEDIPGKELSITMKLSKPVSSYKSKPPHVKLAEALIKSKEILETHEGKHVWGQKIEYIITDSKDKNSAILLRDFKGKWDRKYYWDVQVYAPLMRILKAIWPKSNWEEHNIILFEKIQRQKEKEEKKKEKEVDKKKRELKKENKQLKLL